MSKIVTEFKGQSEIIGHSVDPTPNALDIYRQMVLGWLLRFSESTDLIGRCFGPIDAFINRNVTALPQVYRTLWSDNAFNISRLSELAGVRQDTQTSITVDSTVIQTFDQLYGVFPRINDQIKALVFSNWSWEPIVRPIYFRCPINGVDLVPADSPPIAVSNDPINDQEIETFSTFIDAMVLPTSMETTIGVFNSAQQIDILQTIGSHIELMAQALLKLEAMSLRPLNMIRSNGSAGSGAFLAKLQRQQTMTLQIKQGKIDQYSQILGSGIITDASIPFDSFLLLRMVQFMNSGLSLISLMHERAISALQSLVRGTISVPDRFFDLPSLIG